MVHRLIRGVLIACMTVTACLSAVVEAQVLRPTDNDRVITRNVMEILQGQHLLRKQFDRRMAADALDDYLAVLDPWKQYFTSADVAEFNRRKSELADELNEGDVSIAFDIFQRYQQRVKEASAYWKEFLKPGAHDFTRKEFIVIDPKSREYPKDDAVRREQWRLSIKYNLLTARTDPSVAFNDAKVCGEQMASFERFAGGVERRKPSAVLETFLDCVGGAYDSWTGYTPKSEVSYSES